MKTATMFHNLIAKQNLTKKQNLSEKTADTLTMKRKESGLLWVGEYRDFQDGRRTGDPGVLVERGGYDGTTGFRSPAWLM
jgi:hypothetical protein